MSQANNSNDIFQFNAVNAWLSASFAAKCMLSNSRQFVTNESNFVLGMSTMKMVEAWHQHVLTPMENIFQRNSYGGIFLILQKKS